MNMVGSINRTLHSAGATRTQPLTRKVVAGSSSLRRQVVATQARFGGVVDRPAGSDVDVSKRSGWDSDRDGNIATLPPATDTGRDSGGTDRQRGSPPGGGNHRLLLLDSPRHTQQLVIKSLTVVVPNCDEPHALNCFATSKELGMAIVVSCLKEHAEFYMQQLYRYGVRAAIEPDNTTA